MLADVAPHMYMYMYMYMLALQRWIGTPTRARSYKHA